MLVIEFLILVFIIWEFGWKVKDWFRERRQIRERENDMADKLSHILPEEAEVLRRLILQGVQPGDGIASSIQSKMFPLLERNFVGWLINVEYRDYMKRWAKGKR